MAVHFGHLSFFFLHQVHEDVWLVIHVPLVPPRLCVSLVVVGSNIRSFSQVKLHRDVLSLSKSFLGLCCPMLVMPMNRSVHLLSMLDAFFKLPLICLLDS